jgi:GDPmannose 4,6-dehydratase
MVKRALITGVTGQDGRHLAKLLLSKNYKVYGLVNGQSTSRRDDFRRAFPDVVLNEGDLTDFSSILGILSRVNPNEIYNLGAISFVGVSFLQPEMTSNVTGLGALRILEALKHLGTKEEELKFYQASSSEMFGKVRQTPQDETTPFHPRSPYGVAKTFAHYMTVHYREAYNMHASSGILFNHEGEFRGHEFVTRKITSNVARIKLGLQKSFSLGDLSPMRDWGYAGDYVEAMWLMLQQSKPDDYVIATGKTRSVKEFVIQALTCAGLEPDVDRYVTYDVTMKRPSEVDLLVGNSIKAKEKLGWEPKTSFENLVNIMIENDMRLEFEKVRSGQ